MNFTNCVAMDLKENGTTIFNYLAPHPALSNPKKTHRYAFTLLKQENKIGKDIQSFKKEYVQAIPRSSILYKDSRAFLAKNEEKENAKDALNYEERKYFNTLSLSKLHSLTPAFTCFFTQVYTADTSKVFETLGIHETVYGKVFDQKKLSRKIANSVSSLADGESEAVHRKYKLPTRMQLKAEKKRADLKLKPLAEKEPKEPITAIKRAVEVKLKEGIAVRKEEKRFIYENA
jgi:hypothetical protein